MASVLILQLISAAIVVSESRLPSRRPWQQPQQQQRRSDQQQILNVLIEMQKLTEKEAGLSHFQEDEHKVDAIFEDDIKLTNQQATLMLTQEIKSHRRHRMKRKLTISPDLRWPLPIPYLFDGSHNSNEMRVIREALAYWEQFTCLRFRENHTTTNKLLFTKGRGCWSYVGYTKQINQTVSVGPGCQSNGTIAHELGHAIGFWHEQSRPDRDDYVLINSTNVTRGKLYNFKKRTWGEILSLDVPYDLASVMHYGSKFYAKNENSSDATVLTRDFLMSRVIGQRQELSFYDVKLANKAYCTDVCSTPLKQPCERDGYQDPNACHSCRCPHGFSGVYCQTVAPPLNARCGGVLDAQYNGTVYSPGYLVSGYPPDIQCTWLIQGLPGSHVVLQFVGDFAVAGHVDVCKDFVEVRYNTSLALTGARFCCADPPHQAIRSDTHEMLLLLHTFEESRSCDDHVNPWKCNIKFTGFKARYFMSFCGGCHGDQTQQPVCKKSVRYTCQQSWQHTIQDPCEWWNLRCQNQPRTVTKVRYGTCYRDLSYCCDQYILQNDGITCTQSAHFDYWKRRSTVRRETSTPQSLRGQVRQPLQIWSRWSDWTNCPVTCGGAHVIRTRVCIYAEYCRFSREQRDIKPCATIPCYSMCVHTRTFACGNYRNTCTRREMQRCKPECNMGFILHGDVCQ